MLRFEGHHLSVNLSFSGEKLIAATPLFIGVNPETIPKGPDKGLRALKAEIDLALNFVNSLNKAQISLAKNEGEWFTGFLTNAASRRADLGKPIGIAFNELNPQQQSALKTLAEAYVFTINKTFAQNYMEQIWQQEKAHLRFYWQGESKSGSNFYYRIAGKRLLIEMEAHSGASHVHAVWRDTELDFALEKVD